MSFAIQLSNTSSSRQEKGVPLTKSSLIPPWLKDLIARQRLVLPQCTLKLLQRTLARGHVLYLPSLHRLFCFLSLALFPVQVVIRLSQAWLHWEVTPWPKLLTSFSHSWNGLRRDVFFLHFFFYIFAALLSLFKVFLKMRTMISRQSTVCSGLWVDARHRTNIWSVEAPEGSRCIMRTRASADLSSC